MSKSPDRRRRKGRVVRLSGRRSTAIPPPPKPRERSLPLTAREWRLIFNLLGLSHREAAIARRMIDGWKNDEIAAQLGITPRALATERRQLYRKLGIKRSWHLVVRVFWAFVECEQAGLTSREPRTREP